MEFDQVPPSFRFKPSDEELIKHYLLHKVIGRPLSTDIAITECEVYGKEGLWKKRFETGPQTNTLYFFTHLKTKTANGKKNMERSAGGGCTWKNQTDTNICCGKTKQHIGYVTMFSHTNNRKATKEWVMHEYRLSHDLVKGITRSGIHLEEVPVICKIARLKPKDNDAPKAAQQQIFPLPNNNTWQTTVPSVAAAGSQHHSYSSPPPLPTPFWLPNHNITWQQPIINNDSTTTDSTQHQPFANQCSNTLFHDASTTSLNHEGLVYSAPHHNIQPLSVYPLSSINNEQVAVAPLSSINNEQVTTAALSQQPTSEEDITTQHKALNGQEIAQLRWIAQQRDCNDMDVPSSRMPCYPSHGEIFTF